MEIHLPSPVSEQEISRDTLLEKYAKGSEQTVTEVRRRVRKGASVRYLVPDAVADYIAKRGLDR